VPDEVSREAQRYAAQRKPSLTGLIPQIVEQRVCHQDKRGGDEQQRCPRITGNLIGEPRIGKALSIDEDGRGAQTIENPSGKNDVRQ
jgi:hypothetical protein